jgi:hypothetical protein
MDKNYLPILCLTGSETQHYEQPLEKILSKVQTGSLFSRTKLPLMMMMVMAIHTKNGYFPRGFFKNSVYIHLKYLDFFAIVCLSSECYAVFSVSKTTNLSIFSN